jgi:hypothetical protein
VDRARVWRGVRPGTPTHVKLANIWITINTGGGPTPDKSDIILEIPEDRNHFDTFLNLRVADIWAVYTEWRARGARFLTAPIDNHGYELRCYVQDPDGRIIEVGKRPGCSNDSGDRRHDGWRIVSSSSATALAGRRCAIQAAPRAAGAAVPAGGLPTPVLGGGDGAVLVQVPVLA